MRDQIVRQGCFERGGAVGHGPCFHCHSLQPVLLTLQEYIEGPNLEVFLSGIARAHRMYLDGAYLAGRKESKLERRTIFGYNMTLERYLS